VQASGGVWGGCVYDPDAIVKALGGKPECITEPADDPLSMSEKEKTTIGS
jgi:hypothetical protein